MDIDGELEFYSNLGTIKFTKPIAYQEENGDRNYVEIEYETQGTEYGFKLGDYDRSKELIIDPLLASTFLGRSGRITSIARDGDGNIFVAGRTRSSDFPVTPQAFDTTCGTDGHCDPSVIRTDPEWISQSTVVFVSKFNMSLQSLQASTFFGGDPSYTQDYAHAVHADSMGNVYVAGTTGSPMFPSTPKAYDPVFKGYGGPYLSKFDNDLSAGQQDHDLPKFFPGITILLLQAK